MIEEYMYELEYTLGEIKSRVAHSEINHHLKNYYKNKVMQLEMQKKNMDRNCT